MVNFVSVASVMASAAQCHFCMCMFVNQEFIQLAFTGSK